MNVSKKRLKEIKNKPEGEIDYSEIPELTKAFWDNAKVETPTAKRAISLRVDQDVLDFFKALGRGYQTKMNSVLKSYVKAQEKKQ